MVQQTIRFLLTCACLLVLSLAVTACPSSPGQPVAQSGTPAPHITFQGETDQQQSQTIEINNCDGKAEAVRTERRAQTVSVAVSNELAATLGVDAQVISAEVQAAVGVTKSDSQERSTEITLTAPPGTRMIFELAWIGKEQLGVAENVRGWTVPIAFKQFLPSDVRIVYQNDIDNCPGSPGGNSPVVDTSTPQEPIQNNGSQQGLPTPTPALPSTRYCFGACWQYDEFAKTMTWTGPLDGSEDIWQGDSTSLSRIRNGWTAIFGPLSVPGEIEACILQLNGQLVIDTCDRGRNPYPVQANQTLQVTSASLEAGGFRWKPAKGYGYR